MALVSIVVPVHNGERYLRAALQGCIDQDYRPLEIIVVDDASTDSSRSIASDFASRFKNVRLVVHESNRGLPTALNAGFKRARGELLTWTSDDNIYRPTAISRMAAVLTREPTTDVVYADYSVIDTNATTIGLWQAGATDDLPFHNPVGACFLYRRRVHEALDGYAEDLFLLEDYDFWLRAACLFQMCPLHEDLYLYRKHPASLSATRSDARAALAETCLLRALPGMPRLLRARSHLHLATLLRLRGNYRGARAHVLAALWRSPIATTNHLMRRGRTTRTALP